MRLLLSALLLLASPAPAADPVPEKSAAKPEAAPAPLPPERSIHQTTMIAGKPVAYTTTVGAIPVLDDKGKTIGQVMFTAYTVSGRGSARPVTCPYCVSRMVIDQMPTFGRTNRIQLALFAGGHMFYSRPASTAAFRQTALAIYR